jgi:hypothetical protein
MLDIKDILPYSYLSLNNCLLRFKKINVCLTTDIEVTFELITCDSHSHEMSFISYLFVPLLLIYIDQLKQNIASTCKHIFF